jgi:hypothetical protein
MSAEDWAQATNKRAGIPYERDVIAELDAENARLHGELIDVQCELATARVRLKRLDALEDAFAVLGL